MALVSISCRKTKGAILMTVTSIRQINNNSTTSIKFTTDDSHTFYIVNIGSSIGSNLWIPWLPHRIHVYQYIDIQLQEELFCIYQEDDTVYSCIYNAGAMQYTNCAGILGVCSTGGNRALSISGGPIPGSPPNPYILKMESAP